MHWRRKETSGWSVKRSCRCLSRERKEKVESRAVGKYSKGKESGILRGSKETNDQGKTLSEEVEKDGKQKGKDKKKRKVEKGVMGSVSLSFQRGGEPGNG